MKIQLIRGTAIDGVGYNVGEIVDVDDVLATTLMSTGKGVPHAEKATKSDRSVGLDTSDTPKTKARSKAKK